jgi:serine/threonine protein kinase
MSSNRENMVNPLNTSTKNVIGRENDIYGSCKSVSNYEKIERIGEGTYGDVYCAVNKATKSVVALKRIILHNEKQDGFPLTSLREISALRRSSHPNIVSLLDVVVGGRRDGVFLVFEYCEHDLSSLMRNIKKPFMESEVKRLTMQLLSAVGYLHDHWIIHRDIKLSNLLYNNYGMLKLADFGLCRTFSNPPVAMTHVRS